MQVNTTINYTGVSDSFVSGYLKGKVGKLRSLGASEQRIAQYLNILNRYDGDIDVFSEDDKDAEMALMWFPGDYRKTEEYVAEESWLSEENYDWDAWLSYGIARMETMIVASQIAKMQSGGPETSFKSVGGDIVGLAGKSIARDLRSLLFRLLTGGAPRARVIEVLELANYDEHAENLSWEEVALISEYVGFQGRDNYWLSEKYAIPRKARYTEENFDWERLISDVEARLAADAFMQRATGDVD